MSDEPSRHGTPDVTPPMSGGEFTARDLLEIMGVTLISYDPVEVEMRLNDEVKHAARVLRPRLNRDRLPEKL